MSMCVYTKQETQQWRPGAGYKCRLRVEKKSEKGCYQAIYGIGVADFNSRPILFRFVPCSAFGTVGVMFVRLMQLQNRTDCPECNNQLVQLQDAYNALSTHVVNDYHKVCSVGLQSQCHHQRQIFPLLRDRAHDRIPCMLAWVSRWVAVQSIALP